MKIIKVFSVLLVFLFFAGLSASAKLDLNKRIRIPSAAKGAPKFDEKELIHEDDSGSNVEFVITEDELNSLPADKLLTKAWTALGMGAFDKAVLIANTILKRFEELAVEQQKSLSGKFPKAGDEDKFKELNACGAALYIIAEANEKQGNCQEAIRFYKEAISRYPLSQNWDPRGWYWKVAEESKMKIEKLEEGSCE